MLHNPIVRVHDVRKQIPREKKNFHRVENVIKQLIHTSADFYSQEGRIALGYALSNSLVAHLWCSPNFPRASYLDERMLTYEPVVKEKGRQTIARKRIAF